MGSYATYKCQLCGQEIHVPIQCNYSQQVVAEQLSSIINEKSGDTEYKIPYISKKVHNIHYCKDGNVGLAHFIGYKLDNKI